jgi:hypothetical protein
VSLIAIANPRATALLTNHVFILAAFLQSVRCSARCFGSRLSSQAAEPIRHFAPSAALNGETNDSQADNA